MEINTQLIKLNLCCCCSSCHSSRDARDGRGKVHKLCQLEIYDRRELKVVNKSITTDSTLLFFVLIFFQQQQINHSLTSFRCFDPYHIIWLDLICLLTDVLFPQSISDFKIIFSIEQALNRFCKFVFLTLNFKISLNSLILDFWF